MRGQWGMNMNNFTLDKIESLHTAIGFGFQGIGMVFLILGIFSSPQNWFSFYLPFTFGFVLLGWTIIMAGWAIYPSKWFFNYRESLPDWNKWLRR